MTQIGHRVYFTMKHVEINLGSNDCVHLLNCHPLLSKFTNPRLKTDSASLLSRHSISLLSDRRSIAKLSLLFKLIHNLIRSPFSPQTFKFKPPPKYSIRSYDSLTLSPRFCKTHSSSNSFVPSAIALWNSLPLPIRNEHQSKNKFK